MLDYNKKYELILWNDFKRFSSQIKLSLVLRRCSFQISFQPFLSVCPVTIIRFQIQTWIVPGRCITQIIFWEMIFPNVLFIFSFYLRDRYILLPVMSPEELRLLIKTITILSAHYLGNYYIVQRRKLIATLEYLSIMFWLKMFSFLTYTHTI